MRYAITLLALAGVVVAALALQVHYSTATEPCSINEKWDCGIVNHSPYAVIGSVPVAAIGIVGYVGLAGLAMLRTRRLALAAAVAGLGFSLYLTHVEKDLLMVWCVYCVTSLGIISVLTLLALVWQFLPGRRAWMRDLSGELLRTVDAAEAGLRVVSEADSDVPALTGGWSRKQLIAHLVDSASNNHQRFVRASLAGALEFPGYDQEGNVRVQAVNDASWPLLVGLWASYNRYLAHVIAHMPEEKLGAMCRIGEDEPVTLQFLAEDYLAHVRHHLGQIGLA